MPNYDIDNCEYDTSKLRGRIVEKFTTISAFAKAIDVAVQTISAKLNGTMTITKHDIVLWKYVLDIPDAEIWTYFFTPKVSNFESEIE